MHDPSAEAAIDDIVGARKKAAANWRRSAMAWLSDASSLPDMLVFRRVHEGWRMFFSEWLKIAGTSWQRKQAWRELEAIYTGQTDLSARDYRVLIAANGRRAGERGNKSQCSTPGPLTQRPPAAKGWLRTTHTRAQQVSCALLPLTCAHAGQSSGLWSISGRC